MVRPKNECERGYAVKVEHIHVFFLSLHIVWVLGTGMETDRLIKAEAHVFGLILS